MSLSQEPAVLRVSSPTDCSMGTEPVTQPELFLNPLEKKKKKAKECIFPSPFSSCLLTFCFAFR